MGAGGVATSGLGRVESILGDDASLLSHQCKTIPASDLHLPGPDFVDRILRYANATPNRVPLSDLYFTDTARKIGFQARYLNDITDQISNVVEFRFSDGAAPTVVLDSADASALYVLMPMRV